MTRRLHEDELDTGVDLVRALLGAQFPHLADRDVRPLRASGSSNALFAIGNEHLARLPRQPGGAASIDTEARWSPVLAAALPVAVPEIVAIGRPGAGYPERWSIVRWIPGAPPDGEPADGADGHRLAHELADVVTALRAAPVDPGAREDPELRGYRGGPLAGFDASFRDYAAQCRRLPDLALDIDACLGVWEAALALPAGRGTPRWLHGDLLGENLLLRDGRLAAVLDLGGVGVGDPAVDLVVAWDVLGPAGRDTFRAATGVGDVEWEQGRAWALAIAVMTFPYYGRTMPRRCAGRLAMARAVLADAAV